MEWTIIFTDAYEAWFDHLLEKEKIAIATDLQVLAQMGPSLGRPYVDQVKGSRFSNMKECEPKFPAMSTGAFLSSTSIARP